MLSGQDQYTCTTTFTKSCDVLWKPASGAEICRSLVPQSWSVVLQNSGIQEAIGFFLAVSKLNICWRSGVFSSVWWQNLLFQGNLPEQEQYVCTNYINYALKCGEACNASKVEICRSLLQQSWPVMLQIIIIQSVSPLLMLTSTTPNFYLRNNRVTFTDNNLEPVNWAAALCSHKHIIP